jgi:hypothetical protein
LSSVNTFYLGRRLNFCSRSSARSAFMHAGPPSAMHDGFRASPGIRPVGACSRSLPTRSAGPPTAEAPAGTPTAGAGRFRMGREHHGGGATLSTPLVSHKRPSPKRQTPLPPSHKKSAGREPMKARGRGFLVYLPFFPLFRAYSRSLTPNVGVLAAASPGVAYARPLGPQTGITPHTRHSDLSNPSPPPPKPEMGWGCCLPPGVLTRLRPRRRSYASQPDTSWRTPNSF